MGRVWRRSGEAEGEAAEVWGGGGGGGAIEREELHRISEEGKGGRKMEEMISMRETRRRKKINTEKGRTLSF